MTTLFYYGTDSYQVEQAVASAVEIAARGDWGQLNLSRLDGADPDVLRTAYNHLSTPALGSGQRVVVVMNPGCFTGKVSQPVIEALDQVLARAGDGLLIFGLHGTPDKRLKPVKRVLSVAQAQVFDQIAPWETERLLKHVRTQAAQMDLRIDGTTARVLADAVGNDTRRLVAELTKLKVLGSEPLTPELVQGLVDCQTQSALQIADSLRRGNLTAALITLNDLLTQHEPPLRLLATLIRQFYLWVQTKTLEHDPDPMVATIANLNPYRVKYLKQDVKRVSLAQLHQTLSELLRVEVALKEGADPRLALEQGFVRATQPITQTAG